MNETTNKNELSTKKIIPLDDARASFENKNTTNLYGENEQVLSSSVGKITDESNFSELDETMYTLENSIDSITPKVPIIQPKTIEKIKMAAKEKLVKKSVREELKNVKFDNKPELANLDNTIILNAEVLKQGLIYSEKKRDEEKNNKLGMIIVIIIFVILVLFTLTIPFITNYL